MKNLGQNIKFYRERKSLSQQELAEMVHTERSNISKIETGQSPGSMSLFIRIAEALEVSADKLFEGQEAGQSKGV